MNETANAEAAISRKRVALLIGIAIVILGATVMAVLFQRRLSMQVSLTEDQATFRFKNRVPYEFVFYYVLERKTPIGWEEAKEQPDDALMANALKPFASLAFNHAVDAQPESTGSKSLWQKPGAHGHYRTC